jgi:hypothetical protein
MTHTREICNEQNDYQFTEADSVLCNQYDIFFIVFLDYLPPPFQLYRFYCM